MPAYRCWSVALLAVVLMMAERATAEEASPRLRIGHDSSPNGLIVLDRLGTPIRVRVDGSDAVAAANAVPVTDAALAQMLTSPIAHQTMAEKLRRIVIRHGGGTDIKLEGSTLVVEIIAANPIVGGPSSARLQSAIEDLL